MTEPLQGRLSQRLAAACAIDQVHQHAHSESKLGLSAPALTCARWCVRVQDIVPDAQGGSPRSTSVTT